MTAEKNLQAIQKDEQTYGPIPEDIQNAIGYSSKTGQLKTDHQAKVILWGTGEVYREFLHVDDMAAACIFVMGKKNLPPSPSFLNVGTGSDQTIKETAEMIKHVVGFSGEVVFDSSKPDGTPKSFWILHSLINMDGKQTITY